MDGELCPIFYISIENFIYWKLCIVLVVGEIANLESLQYDFVTIEASTNNFSDDNKIGEGGFGVVYKVVNYLVLNEVWVLCSN